jgi:hypothetical protein
MFLIEYDLKKGDALLPLLFNIDLMQWSPNYGPSCDFIRPANELCRNAPTELIFQ